MKSIFSIILLLQCYTYSYSYDYLNLNIYSDIASLRVNKKHYSFSRLYLNTYFKTHITKKITLNNQMVFRTYKFRGSKSFNGTYINNLDYSFLSMYISYDFEKGKRLSFGLFPFTNNSFSQYLFGNDVKGNGLTTLINTPVYGIFYSQRTSKHNIISFGFFEYRNNLLHTFDYIIPNANSSPGYFFIDKYTKGFNYIEFNYIRLHMLYNNKSLGSINLTGLGYSYNRLYDKGYILYSVVNMSKVFDDTSIIEEDIKKTSGYLANPSLYRFQKENKYGYSILLGTRYENDNIIPNKTVFFGLSYFRSSKYWVSTNRAKETKNNIYDIKGTAITYNVGIQVNKHLSVSYKHYYVNRYIQRPGTISSYINKKTKSNIDVLFFNYKF